MSKEKRRIEYIFAGSCKGLYQILKPTGNGSDWHRWGKKFDGRGLANWLINEVLKNRKYEVVLEYGLEERLKEDRGFVRVVEKNSKASDVSEFINLLYSGEMENYKKMDLNSIRT